MVELTVAASLMSVLFLIGWTISQSFTGVRKTRDFETAIALASQAIEAVRAARFCQIGVARELRKDTLMADFNSAKETYDGNEGFVPIVKIGATEFRREVSVTDCPSRIAGVSSGLKLIRVTVSWKASEDGTPLTFEAATTQADLW
ncbi:MAG TPA: hypothetical protein VIV61_10835 [Candidatus Ozemobacteraceae bacterium]